LISIPLGLLLGSLGFFSSRWFAIPMFIPMVIDAETQRAGKRHSNNYLRMITGFCFGLGLGFFIYTWITSDIRFLD